MKIKIRLRNGNSFDFDVPDTTHFGMLCLHARASGYFLSDQLHISYDMIESIAIEGQRGTQNIVVPGSETKQ